MPKDADSDVEVLAITQPELERYRFVLQAAETGQLGVIRAFRNEEPVALLAILYEVDTEEGKRTELTPIAEMLQGPAEDNYRIPNTNRNTH